MADLQIGHLLELDDPQDGHFQESENRSFPEKRKSRIRPLIRQQIHKKNRPPSPGAGN